MRSKQQKQIEAPPLSETLYQTLFEQSDRFLFVVDPKTGRLVSFNDKLRQCLEYTRKDFSHLNFSDFVIGESTKTATPNLLILNAKGLGAFRARYRTRKGALLDVQVRAKRITLKRKPVLLFDAHEIAARKLSDQFKRLSTAIFEAATEAILVTDVEGNILAVNPAFTRITGYSAEEVLGKNPKILQSGRQDKAFYKKMWETICTEGHWQGEIWNRRKNGKIYPEWLSITAVKDEEDHSVQYAALFSDITQRKAGEAKLEFQAYYDSLTRLPNRTLFLERLSQAIKQTRRNDSKAALLFVDLDRFKAVNDHMGHAAGDTVLKMSAARLQACVRETDTVARSGGDEFLIVLTNIKTKEQAARVAKEILVQFAAPFQIKGRKASLGASIGIAMVPEDGEQGSTLIENADLAMYRSKTSGRNLHHFYDKKMKKEEKGKTKIIKKPLNTSSPGLKKKRIKRK